MSEKLTPKQLENWRKMLPLLGIDAALLDDEEVQAFRDAFQHHVEEEMKAEEAKCKKTS